MNIVKLTLKNEYMSSNCYLLVKNKDVVVIDPGFEDDILYNYLKVNKLNLTKIILTHGHYDHWTGLSKLKDLYPNALVYASTLDEYWFLNNPFTNYRFKIDVDLNLLTELDILGETFKIIKTPGHSLGSICLYYNNFIIVGDVIFKEGIGRTDLYGGNYHSLIKSIKLIYELDNNTIIYPGHGLNTKVYNEKKNNPFVSS